MGGAALGARLSQESSCPWGRLLPPCSTLLPPSDLAHEGNLCRLPLDASGSVPVLLRRSALVTRPEAPCFRGFRCMSSDQNGFP